MDALLNTAPCGFVSFADDGTIVEVNATLAEMLGYPRVELLGWHIDKVLPPGGRIFYQTYLFPLLRVQESVEEIYLALRTKDGRDVPVLLNGRRKEREGRILSDCICLRMIQRHEYEDQLLQARRLAEQSSAAKDRFLSMMSHDIRTPLTAIQGNAQLMAAGALGPLNEDQRDAVREIAEACRVQMTIIGDILEFARLESGKIDVKVQPVPVTEAVARAVAMLRLQAKDAGLGLSIEDCRDDVEVLADANRLQQILLNLLTNAIKFTPAGGSISVVCATRDERAEIRVCDTGVGIAADQLQHIFSPFVQVESGGGAELESRPLRGVGLGLAISRDLARAMQGDVTVESTPGAGSVFTIHLPAAAQRPVVR